MSVDHEQQPATTAELRKFGLTIGGIFLVLTLVLFFRGRTPVMAAAGVLAVYLLSFAIADPDKLAGFHRGWWKGTFVVGHYMGVFWFSVIYWILFTPAAFAAGLFGFDPLGTKRFRKADSYWHDRPTALSSDHYEKQYAKMEDSRDGS